MASEHAYGVALFHTNSAVMRAERTLLREGLAIKLIPVPRNLSSDCGIAMRFNADDEKRIREILEADSVAVNAIHSPV